MSLGPFRETWISWQRYCYSFPNSVSKDRDGRGAPQGKKLGLGFCNLESIIGGGLVGPSQRKIREKDGGFCGPSVRTASQMHATTSVNLARPVPGPRPINGLLDHQALNPWSLAFPLSLHLFIYTFLKLFFNNFSFYS